MNKLLLLSVLFLIPSQGNAVGANPPGVCDGSDKCAVRYFLPKNSGRCLHKAVCIGMDADLTCASGSLCVNLGTKTPGCDATSTCKTIPMEYPFCRWEGTGLNVNGIKNKSFTCDLKKVLTAIGPLPVK